ncbi:MAG: hypothetical protein C4530_00950 [Desulfobacteraceae bacterium]|nr:MAG: hypothetical protein C4530_00950 [Desulfobacteraceae bacterium]
MGCRYAPILINRLEAGRDRGQMTEVRSRMTEVRSQMTEARSRKVPCNDFNLQRATIKGVTAETGTPLCFCW